MKSVGGPTNFEIVSWLKKRDQQQQQETELLRQWRRSRLQARMENLPLELLLRHQSRRLAEIAEAELEKTGSLPVHRRLRRLIRKKIGSASGWLAKRPFNWLSRRRSLQPLRRSLVQARRRLLLFLLVSVVRILRRSLGNQKL